MPIHHAVLEEAEYRQDGSVRTVVELMRQMSQVVPSRRAAEVSVNALSRPKAETIRAVRETNRPVRETPHSSYNPHSNALDRSTGCDTLRRMRRASDEVSRQARWPNCHDWPPL